MNNALKLRTLSSVELPLYRCMCALQAEGRQVALRAMQPPPGYATVCARLDEREYEGWVDAAGLLQRRYPELIGLAWHSIDERYLCGLLEERATMSMIPGPSRGWSHVRVTGIVRKAPPAQVLLSLEDPDYAAAIFSSFPDLSPAHLSIRTAEVNALALTLRFCVGTTCMPLVLLRRIEPGDVVLIETPCNLANVGATALCGFQYEGANIMLNEQIVNDEDIQPGANHGQRRDALEPAAPGQYLNDRPFNIDQLTVSIEFVLQREQVTVAQLSRFHSGTLLPMRSGAADNVILRVNGQFFGHGELIQVGEQLAVEVKTVRLASPE